MLYYRRILVISDNLFLINEFHTLLKKFEGASAKYMCAPVNTALLNSPSLQVKINAVRLKEEWQNAIKDVDLVISLHCKQLFPEGMIKAVKCINVHPGFNPYNRGWFPQVFCIFNKMKAGATIHEIDEQLDHGAIIAQKEITIDSHDTSLTAYEKIQQAEVELLQENLEAILNNTYTTVQPAEEGNVNLKKDFNALLQLDLNKKLTMGEAIDYLRAMTHGNYKNAYFIDEKTGEKVFVNLSLQKEERKS